MKPYCVYLTCYSGNKMPPFYIGSTSVYNVDHNYHGSVDSIKYGEIWRQELIDNPQSFTTKIICTHETRQEAYDKELKLQLQLNVVKSKLYINQSVARKHGFMGMDTSGVNHPLWGKFHSEETKKKQSLVKMGNNNPSYSKSPSKTTRKKQSDKLKGVPKSEEAKRNMSLNKPDISGSKNPMFGKSHSAYSLYLMSTNRKGTPAHNTGKIWINNGIDLRTIHPSEPIPEGWCKGNHKNGKKKNIT